MVRTQIYLSDFEHKTLRSLAQKSGKTLSELVRSAIDRMIEPEASDDRLALLREARGIWKDRTDLPDMASLRREADTRLDRSR